MHQSMTSIAMVTTTIGVFIQTNSVAFAQATNGPARDSGFHHGHGMMWGGGSFGGVGMFIGFFIMLLLVAAVVLVLRSTNMFGSSGASGSSGQNRNIGLDILKERFAKGDIDAKEFDERKRILAD